MGKSREDPLDLVEFRCVECGHEFECAPGRVEDDSDRPWHPFAYFSDCPRCDFEAEQLPRQIGLLKAWANATGPRTEEGKARSAANLAGHPTPEETRATRLNALKHGRFAQVATFFPARPGQYPQCENCHYRGKECIERPPAHHKNPAGCLLRTELYLKYQIAVADRDPTHLAELMAGNQARLQALLEDMFLQMLADGGPRIKSVEWYYDKDGGFHLAQYNDEKTGEVVRIHKIEEHPLLKRIIELVAKNSMTLEDLGMTPKVQDDQELLSGFLQHEKENSESAQAYREQLQQKQQQLLELIKGNTLPAGRVIEAEVVHDG